MGEMAAVLEKLTKIEQRQQAIDDQVAAATARRHTGASTFVPPGTPPFARKGESIMSSRGFQFGKLIGAVGKNAVLRPEDAKIELEFCDRFGRKFHGAGYRPESAASTMVPFWPEGFSRDLVTDDEYYEMKSLVMAGVSGADPNEIAWYAQKYYGQKAAASPAQSWVDQSLGGALVPPPTFGPPIELLRNKEALLNAGATTIPLGPSGRMVMPRLTRATQGGWSGENQAQTPTTAGTGQLDLSAKKVIAVVALPGELLRFGAPATEALIRADIFKTVALIMDRGFLDGPGSSTQPLGLATMGAAAGNPYGMAIVTPSSANELAPQDVYSFLAAIEENNATPSGWLMRPKMSYSFSQARWTPYSGGAAQGGFVFEMNRGADGEVQSYLAGLRVTKTVQVSGTRGNGSQTYVLCGDFPDYLVAMFGAIELTQTDAGWTLLSSDQVAVRAILSCDGGPRHPGAFAFCDNLGFTVGP